MAKGQESMPSKDGEVDGEHHGKVLTGASEAYLQQRLTERKDELLRRLADMIAERAVRNLQRKGREGQE